MEITATVSGLKNLEKAVRAADKESRKALQTAVKVEGFRLRGVMLSELRAGAPGGRKFPGLSYLRRYSGGRLRPDRPYGISQADAAIRGGGRSMGSIIRYHVEKNDPVEVAVGWSGPKISNSYKRLALALQEGFESSVTDRRREFFARAGGRLGRRRQFRKYFFIKKSTTVFRTPARPVIAPFWEAHRAEAWKNVRENFRRKMRGERI